MGTLNWANHSTTSSNLGWHVRPVDAVDADTWRQLRQDLWPDPTAIAHQAARAAFFRAQRLNC